MTTDSAQKKLLGYVMLSTDITDTPAYSGKAGGHAHRYGHAGRFVGMKVLKHSEPILLLGIPESALINFNNQYIGKSVTDTIEVGPSRPDENVIGVDAISGATVTVVAQNQVVMASGSAVARQTGIIAPTVREQPRFVTTGQTTIGPNSSRWARCSNCWSSPNRWACRAAPSPSSKCGSAT